ncbi:alpha/beta fold hydrolase [Actibacterium lipolyticum]|uniref:Alpha/beta hydrolase n=1 Tax=Actibacterium lipolyticum TaxID=1524263 RepID=A0A238KT39_9RHOB|nr:hypothetical protein [Actibacterium lipolyticum]SMX45888.1 hypothetical protein COL8621_02916 [Actibacterium lipolyticum]
MDLNPEPNETADYYEVYNAGSDTTLVAFGGLGHAIGQPMFEFRKTLQPLNVNLVFFRDVTRGWYHHPVDGFGDTFADKAKRIEEIIGGLGSKKVLFLGSSAGGFAALMFAGLVRGVDDCLLFGPQVFIDPKTRNLLGDKRWPKLTNAITAEKYMNVWDVVETLPERIRIIAGTSCAPDMTHALYAGMAAKVDVHVLTRAGHNPAKEMRSGGILGDVLAEFRDGETLRDRENVRIAKRMAALKKL